MISKKEVVKFFNNYAKDWDSEMIRDDAVIDRILDNAGVQEGCSVLDVACGTGVLFNDYLRHGAAAVTGIDISPEMIKIASGKFNDPRITTLCADADGFHPDEKYDIIMVYNAFPHFQDPEGLIRTLYSLLNPGGRLSIAHGMSRESIDRHHSGAASAVSSHLMSAEELKKIMDPYIDVDVMVSDDLMYQVAGQLRQA